MVELSKSIANKIKEKQGDITEDETIRFKSYLLSMGIANPVTRETYGSGTQYHMQLAKQLAGILQTPLEERGGIMSLTEVYCLVNRARGLEVRHCLGSIFYSRTSVIRKLKRVKMFPSNCSFCLSTARCDQFFIKIRGVLPFFLSHSYI